MKKIVTFRLTDTDFVKLDEAVSHGGYSSRSDFLRDAIGAPHAVRQIPNAALLAQILAQLNSVNADLKRIARTSSTDQAPPLSLQLFKVYQEVQRLSTQVSSFIEP